VIGSIYGDLIQADNGTDMNTGDRGADQLHASAGFDTFVFNNTPTAI
jgi:Ca2+-binding RTX toxin-like protein